MKIIKCLIFCIIILIGCNSVDKKLLNTNYINDKTNNIFINEIKQNFKKEIIVDYKFIELESSLECLIGKIDKILFGNNKFYILDSKTKGIYLFDSIGNYIRKINKKGKGPGEYIRIDDFDIDSEGNIYLLDCWGHKIIKYNSDATVYNEFFIKNSPDNFKIFNMDSCIFFYNNFVGTGIKHKIVYYNLKTKKIDKEEFTYRKILDQPSLPIISKFQLHGYQMNKSLFCQNYSNLIYSIAQDELFLKYNIDFGKFDIKNLPQNIKPEELLNYLRNSNVVCFFRNFYETEKYLTSEFVYLKDFWILFYSKTDSIVYLIKYIDAINKKIPLNIPIGISNEYFISEIDRRIYDKQYKSKDIKKHEENFSVTNNPVLLLYKLK